MSEASAPMQRALALAEQALGNVSPNPAVGAVVVKDGRVVGEGYTQPPGGNHAEIEALRVAGEAARDSTVYVTLEPCSHYGRTPPCVDALTGAGVARVVCAIIDPDESVSGRGKAALEAAGIAVEVGDGSEAATKQLEAYIKHRRTGLPFVTVKYAASLDGRISAASGDSRWVSGPETREWAHANRTKIDAILQGASTIVIDDPQLTARPDGVEAERQPLRVVVDSTGRISTDRKVLQGSAKTLIATTERSSEAWRQQMQSAGAEVLVLAPDADGRVPLRALLEELGRRGVLSLLVEGGGVLHGSFFDQRLVDKVTAVLAPMIVGAANAATAVAGRGAQYMREAVRLREMTVERLGDDVLVTGYPVWPDAPPSPDTEHAAHELPAPPLPGRERGQG
jgi:diaminohydroxyphosphoribosylaminopyrimidine deaminase/5-amino-6-(5-phosphoribosylamino)uracil reductase